MIISNIYKNFFFYFINYSLINLSCITFITINLPSTIPFF